MRAQDLLNCAFPLWYPNFREQSIESIVLKLPKVFIEYLLTDGLFLPDDYTVLPEQVDEPLVIGLGDEEKPTSQETKFNNIFSTDEFIEFKLHVVSAIAELGGKVFPKVNWSSPKDASWIAINSSLCCETFNDICLLMKSSDFVTHDLTDPFMTSGSVDANIDQSIPSVEYVLALRKWIEIIPSGEFRCFVKDSNLLAISQRSTQYFDFIESQKHSITRRIERFFKSRIHGSFPNPSFIFDVYMPGGARPVLIDFNPYHSVTDSLMFSWDELNDTTSIPELAAGDTVRGIVFRSLEKEGMVSTDMRMYAYPVDFQHLSTGQDPAKLIDLLKLHQRSSSSSTDSD